jgi:hypothetical protein
VAAGVLAATAGLAGAGPAAEPAPPAEGGVHVAGRVFYTWYEKPDLRVLMVIGGFSLRSGGDALTARDGVVWFDEAEARRTRRVRVGVYAETAVEFHRADGAVEKYDSVYLGMEDGAELALHTDQPLHGKAESAPLYLRGKMRQREYQARGGPEPPKAVVPAPAPPAAPPTPGVREAAVPQEVTVVPRDDASKVNFTSSIRDGRRVSVWTGGVILVRGEMEMAADNVVLWTGQAAGEPARPERRTDAEAYLEGNVRIHLAERELACSQLYYDFGRHQALALDAKIMTFSQARNVPLYYYAKEVRQLAENVFVGQEAWMTTDEFGVPNYDIGAKELTLVDLTPEPAPGAEPPEGRRLRFLGRDLRFRVRRLPLTWWPRMAGDVTEGETALRTIRLEQRSNRGTGLQTQWHLFKLLGLKRPPEGFGTYLNLDFWSERGPGIGVESKYARRDFYGQFLSYYLHDTGEDSVGDLDLEPPGENRGRVLWRHRHYLPRNWEATLEVSYLSDRQFLNEFYEQEDEEGKAQETLLYLKRQSRDRSGLPTEQALTILLSGRVNNWYTRTEFLPQVGYNIIGHSLLKDKVTYFQDSEVSLARYRPDEALGIPGSGPDLVADTIHELDLPLRIGPVGLVPFGEARLSWFEEDVRGDSTWRWTWRAGARASMQAWRVYPNVRHRLLDLAGLRHIHTFDVSAYTANTTVPMQDLVPFDVTEAGTPVWQGVNDIGAVDLGWRQRFQTKRGPPGAQQTVDWLILDLEGAFYHNRNGPFIIDRDGKRAFDHLDFRTDWRVTDSTRLWTDSQYNTAAGALEFFAIGATVVHSPRLTYTLGHRYIPDGEVSRTYVSANYRLNEKWHVGFLEQFDFDDMRSAQTTFTLTRRMNRWLARLRLDVDPGEDETFVGLEFQPMGLPEVRIGM